MPFDYVQQGGDADLKSITVDELNGGVTGDLAVDKIYGERLASKSPSGVSSVEFTSKITSDFDRYVIHLTDFVPANDGDNLRLVVSTDGGSTYKTSSDYDWVRDRSIAGTASQDDSATAVNSIPFLESVGSGSGEGAEATLRLSQPSGSTIDQLIYADAAYIDSGGNLCVVEAVGRYTTAEAYDAVKIEFAGNIESGEADLYGVMP